MSEELDYTACYNKALDLLARRSHFEGELEAKLRRRGFDVGDVGEALRSLREECFLDDETVAREFVASRRRRRGEVGRRLIQELRKRGVDPDLAGRVVGELDPAEDRELAEQAVERLRARGASNDRIGRHLDRKGFSKSVILDLLG